MLSLKNSQLLMGLFLGANAGLFLVPTDDALASRSQQQGELTSPIEVKVKTLNSPTVQSLILADADFDLRQDFDARARSV